MITLPELSCARPPGAACLAISCQVLPVRTLAGRSATMSEPGRALASLVLTKIHRRSPVRVSAKPPASLLPRRVKARRPGPSRVTSASPSSQMITAQLPVVHPLELAGLQLMILHRYGQALHSGIERRSLRDDPGAAPPRPGCAGRSGVSLRHTAARRTAWQARTDSSPRLSAHLRRSPPKAAVPPADDRIAAHARRPQSVPAARVARCRQQTAEASAMNKVITRWRCRQSARTAVRRALEGERRRAVRHPELGHL